MIGRAVDFWVELYYKKGKKTEAAIITLQRPGFPHMFWLLVDTVVIGCVSIPLGMGKD